MRRLSRELGERGEEALRESREHEALITRSMEDRKKLQVDHYCENQGGGFVDRFIY